MKGGNDERRSRHGAGARASLPRAFTLSQNAPNPLTAVAGTFNGDGTGPFGFGSMEVAPGTAAQTIAQTIEDRLEDYPVLDEMDYSQREQDAADETWRNCYREKERIKYIRKHRSQFDFASFRDLLDCVRGKSFAGYAIELINS